MLLIAVRICSKRPLSLAGSLINKFFFAVNTFCCVWEQGSVFYQIHFTHKKFFQITNHSGPSNKRDFSVFVKYHQNIHIAVFGFLASGKGTEKPCLFNGLCLEILLNDGDDMVCHSIFCYKFSKMYFANLLYR